MSHFEYLMDDMKEALILSKNNKKLFAPALIANFAFIGVMMIIGVITFIILMTSISTISESSTSGNTSRIIFITLAVLILFAFISIFFLVVELGIIRYCIALIDQEPLSAKLFFSGIKTYLIPVFFTNIALTIIYIIGFIILLIPILLYYILIGIPTGGYGLIFLSAAFNSLLGFWTIILMNNKGTCFKSILQNIKFGKQHFKLMTLIFFLQTLFTASLPALFGLILGNLGILFFVLVVSTYFNLVILLTYRRLEH